MRSASRRGARAYRPAHARVAPFLSAMSRLALLSVLLLAACSPPDTAPPRSALEDSIRAVLAEHPGVLAGVSLRDALTGTTLDVNGDSLMHAASTMKVPVMIEVFRQAEAGRFSLDDPILVKNTFTSILDSSSYEIEDDSDVEVYDKLGQRVPIRYLVERMITVSSNLATNLLIELVGADSVQATIEKLGTERMRVYRGVEDLPAYRAGLNNTATARDLAVLMDKLGRGEAVSPEADRAMREILLRQQYNETIPAGLPEGTPVAHKTGFITGINHDAALVMPQDTPPYTLVILTRGFAEPEAAYAMGARITRLVHAALRSESAAKPAV